MARPMPLNEGRLPRPRVCGRVMVACKVKLPF
jgi:hypothetical protein